MAGPEVELLRGLLVLVDHTSVGSGQLNGPADDGVQDRLKVERRADGAAHRAQRLQLLDRARQLEGARLQLLEQPDVLDRDDGLVGEGR